MIRLPIQGTVKDVLTPMVFRLSYSMDLPTDCTLCPVLDAFRPTHSEMEVSTLLCSDCFFPLFHLCNVKNIHVRIYIRIITYK